MKLWLDDEREAPEGWQRTYTATGCIGALRTGKVTHLSLDHDLGTEATGYDVLCWIERAQRVNVPAFALPEIAIHSANPVGRARMEAALRSIRNWNESEVRDGE